jgi:phosphate/sulfate permease
MLIWILALVLFACLAFVGYSLGVIRTTFTLIGLIIGGLIAWPTGHFFNGVLGITGLKNPVILWLLGPFISFCIVLIIFKVVGEVVHRKIDVYFKYKAGELKMGLWNRLTARLGICVGLANAAVYLILICTVIYVFSYGTIQMISGPEAPFLVKTLNNAGNNLKDTGMIKVAMALEPLPDSYYQTLDIIGLIYHNDLLEGRLSRYPAFLAMGQRQEFQDIGKDKDFTEMRQRQAPIGEIYDYPKMQSIVGNPDMLKEIWAIVSANLGDIKNYLLTGKSDKYQEPVLGKWTYNLARSIAIYKQGKANIDSRDMALARRDMGLIFSKMTMVASPEPGRELFVKDLGKIRVTQGDRNVPPPTRGRVPNSPAPAQAPVKITVDLEKIQGHWEGSDDKYEFTFPEEKHKWKATVEGDRMTVTGGLFPVVFERDY